MVVIKSKDEIVKMRRAGRIVAEVLALIRREARAGISTLELDALAEELIRRRGAVPAFKGYKAGFVSCGPFPATLCTSINSEVVHGIPGGTKLNEGDILSVDTGAQLDGYFGDAAISLVVGGNGSAVADKLIEVTQTALFKGIEYCWPGKHLSDISHAIQKTVEREGFSVVRRFVGHGIGSKMHEDPPIPNYGEPGSGPKLKPGMVLAIEPMVNEGSYEVIASMDHWVVTTRDGGLSAHFEHTVAVMEDGPEILTQQK
ncbi:MAG: type I methionyl aminopeptidase [Actinobacteria bacterium]|nr:type I methionyl aminopeptidase [Actinomycetota bacterium]